MIYILSTMNEIIIRIIHISVIIAILWHLLSIIINRQKCRMYNEIILSFFLSSSPSLSLPSLPPLPPLSLSLSPPLSLSPSPLSHGLACTIQYMHSTRWQHKKIQSLQLIHKKLIPINLYSLRKYRHHIHTELIATDTHTHTHTHTHY